MMDGGFQMKKMLVALAAIALLSTGGCFWVGKAPVGKGPVVTKY